MRKYLLLLVTLFFAATTFAQPQNKGFFVVKGKIQNEHSLDTLNASLTCYISNGLRICSIPIAKDGTFEQKIETEGNQNFYFNMGHFWTTFYVKPNDTITLNYDGNDISNTMSIIGNNTERTNELNFNYRFSKEFYPKQTALEIRLYPEGTFQDSVKVSWVNNEYNRETNFIAKDTNLTNDTRKRLLSESYFYWCHEVLERIFLNNIKGFIKYDLVAGNNNIALDVKNYYPRYGTLNLADFYNIPSYRDFINLFATLNYSQIYPKAKPFWGIMNDGAYKDLLNENSLEKNYYFAMASFDYYPIRDWYITNKIIDAFKGQRRNWQTFEQVEKVMMEFFPACQNEDYKNDLLKIYNASKKYISGKPAPGFTLKDANDKYISLSDFKGKAVLLDFWGVHCGPCIGDLENTVPKVHEKYKGKNVVFINVCVEDTEDNWKDAIKKYHVQGVNLFAKGWPNNPVRKAYGIEGIPHYILIDKNGNYADYNCPAYSLLQDNNILDKTLAQ